MSVLINLPDDHRDAWKVAAAAEGIPLAEWIRNACSVQLPAKVRKGLSEMAGPGNPEFKKRKKKPR